MARWSLRWRLNHHHLKHVLKHNHSAVAELDVLAGRADRSRVRRESACESVNVLGAAALDERPLNLRDLSWKTARHLSRGVQCAVWLSGGAGTRTAGIDLAVEAHDACSEPR